MTVTTVTHVTSITQRREEDCSHDDIIYQERKEDDYAQEKEIDDQNIELSS